jgi:hypothetical protein
VSAFAIRLCFFDPERDGQDAGYGGERASFVIEAPDVSAALTRWLDRAEARGVRLHILEAARAVQGGELPELVAAAQAGGIAAGQSYAYAPLEPGKGVCFGLAETGAEILELAVKAQDTGAALREILAQWPVAEAGALTALDGLCDLSQADAGATFDGEDLALVGLSLGMQAESTLRLGARYARDGGAHG